MTQDDKQRTIFDFTEFINDWFVKHKCSDVHWNVDLLQVDLQGAFRRAVESAPLAGRPEPSIVEGTPLLTSIGVFYRLNNHIHVQFYEVYYPSALKPEQITVVSNDKSGYVWLPGGKPLFEELVKGTRADFDNYRNEPVIKSLLSALRPNGPPLLLRIAQPFSRRFIEIASEKDDLPGMIKGGVSRESDCIVLDKEGYRKLN